MIAKTLGASGYLVVEATSPIGVGALVRRHEPHVVVLDVMMPGLSGEAVARLLSSAKRKIPIVFYSAMPEGELHELTKRIPDSTFVQKGSSLVTLVETVHRMCRLYAMGSVAPPQD